jgi:hypothetical protein
MKAEKSGFKWLVSLGQSGAWFILAFGALLSAIFIREALKDFLFWYRVQHLNALRESGIIGGDIRTTAQITFIDFFAIFILAILVVSSIVVIDNYLRRGRASGLLGKRIFTVAGIEGGIIIGTILLRMLFLR